MWKARTRSWDLRVISAPPTCGYLVTTIRAESALLAGTLSWAANSANCALPHALTVPLQILVRTSLFITHPAKPGTHCRCRQPPHALWARLHSLPPLDKLYKGDGKDADHRCTEQNPPFRDFRFSELKILSSDGPVVGSTKTLRKSSHTPKTFVASS